MARMMTASWHRSAMKATEGVKLDWMADLDSLDDTASDQRD